MSCKRRWGIESRVDNTELAKEQILLATYKLIASTGLEKITISDIAKKASISRPTIYRYFGSLDEIISCLFASRQDEFFEGMRRTTEGFEHDLPSTIVEMLCYAQRSLELSRGLNLSNTKGPNTGKITCFYPNPVADKHLDNILKEPLKHHQHKTGRKLDSDAIKEFIHSTIIMLRNNPGSTEDAMRRQMRAIMSIGT